MSGIGLILIGFALFVLSRPYMEMATGERRAAPAAAALAAQAQGAPAG